LQLTNDNFYQAFAQLPVANIRGVVPCSIEASILLDKQSVGGIKNPKIQNTLTVKGVYST
jgi:hypothetical protein